MRARETLAAPEHFHPEDPIRDRITGARHVRREVSARRELALARAQCDEDQARLEEAQVQLKEQRAQLDGMIAQLQPALAAAAAQQSETWKSRYRHGDQDQPRGENCCASAWGYFQRQRTPKVANANATLRVMRNNFEATQPAITSHVVKVLKEA